jgi:hypothetical protein
MEHDGELDNGHTYLFALELADGDYEINGIRLFTNSGIAALQRNDQLGRFSIPFTVRSGEVRYVGNIHFDEHSEPGVKTLVTYDNNFERDLAAIKVVQPYVYWNNALNEPLNLNIVSEN